MSFVNKITLISLVLILIFVGTASAACTITVNNVQVEVKVDGSYASTIDAMIDDRVDSELTFRISNYSGQCPNDINTKLIITRYNDHDNTWEDFQVSSVKSVDLDERNYDVPPWNNEFTIDDDSDYTKYRVKAVVFYDNNGVDTELGTDTATVNVQGGSCDSINLNVSDISINESRTTTKTFSVENTSNEDFEITAVDVDFTSSYLTLDDLQYNDNVSSDSEEDIDVSIAADSISGDYDTTGVFSVSGYLGNEYCSVNDIGEEEFDITINEMDDSSSNDEDCEDIDLIVRDFTVDEASETKVAFSVKNNSTSRFEITGVSVTSNGFDLSNYYNEKYVFSGQVTDIILKAVAPNVAQNKLYNNILRVRGVFTDGRSCSFDNINSKSFNTSIVDNPTQSTGVANCSNFSISAPTQINVQSYGTIPISISNGTNQMATIYIEGTVNAQPSVIVLPANTSISREVNFSVQTQNGEISFRPVISGCYPSVVKTQISNNVSGSINQLRITTSTREDQNTGALILTLGINNPTNKTFSGIANVTMDGYNSTNKSINAVPGNTTTEITLTPNGEFKSGNGTITFQSNGEEITQSVNSSGEGSFSGLFAFGSNIGGLGVILLILVAVVLIVGLVLGGNSITEKEAAQRWVDQNKN